ncbi:aminoacetone oxidase family FAD-binding enzyme [uncultured Ruminococcus sp.]|uniref:aminoacetone oxidase family FAD-binding enzyme n=1 Tax=uncultured Ruminococcus sp. TaxID=165186 RepID=UPI00292FFFC4|nr:aminoacetone oxidase family FAD-binding enzyme [uncultured Ruminococcus sp.]
MKKERVYAAVIGGGASGMLCAIRAAERHPDRRIVILEKADRVGKKLLVTGNGRCNLSNLSAGAKNYHGEGSEKLINILYENYSPEAVLETFHTLGLLSRPDSEGRVYPLSNQASSVLDVIRRRLRELSVEERCNADIRGIQKSGGGYEVYTADGVICADRLVIASGGHADYAGRESGSRDILRLLGLSTVKPTPSLSPVNVSGDLLKPLKGVRAGAEATLIQNGRAVKTERGEVQFTENALSGICIFNLSREANRFGGEISLNLLPDYNSEQITDELTVRVQRDPDAPASEIFTGMLHKNLGLSLLKASGVKPSRPCKDISNKELSNLCRHLTDWRFVCEKSRDFRKAQVTAGGVRLSEIDPRTFEAKKHRGLYLIGEALDIDGDCGGYNLQFAFASGLCAGDCL